MVLEHNLKIVNDWFGSRFKERYTSPFCEGVIQDISAVVSDSDLQKVHREEICDIFRQDIMVNAMSCYVASHYTAAIKSLVQISETYSGYVSLNEEDKCVLDAALASHRQMIRFVVGAVKSVDKSSSGVQAEFKRVYDTSFDFSKAYLALPRLLIHEATRVRKQSIHPQNLKGMLGDLTRFMEDADRYNDLYTKQLLHVQERFYPRVFNHVLGGLYS
ncbi:hypothetical protein A2642_02945 [Candidatus Nomurabacteria bacterium RIFCSPHIGHO2_01_FULL_39_10]|uniref:Uncharacterized protein n=1 Tax=Candidatus Nomurabacteria bacterium RIFCSPHIGHO2_01_FULL_39_10 TaxID=1801733 RepID=A0A1F6V5K9_9BACT|nr:MAG: hypothetical protein A2642_02945 [Candidatus Nomurabacteria bacterium RIFCSPHIGHO2_01_FULL_39_10]